MQTLVAALDLLGLALLIGISASWLWLAPLRADSPVQASPALGGWFGLSLVLLAAASLAGLLIRTSALAEVEIADAWPQIPSVLANTDFGWFWILRISLIALLAVLWLWRRDPALAGIRPVAATAGLLIAFVVSATGHLGEEGSLEWENLNNTLHITAGCLWGGTVAIYALAVLPRLRELPSRHVAETAGRLSTLAAIALGLVLLTGLYNAWDEVGSISALWTTEYGQILLVKLAFVATMTGIGTYNRFVAVPAVQTWAKPPQLSPKADAPVQRFNRLLRTDVVLFVLILLAAATLANSTPSVHK